jgi:hypothetical protein
LFIISGLSGERTFKDKRHASCSISSGLMYISSFVKFDQYKLAYPLYTVANYLDKPKLSILKISTNKFNKCVVLANKCAVFGNKRVNEKPLKKKVPLESGTRAMQSLCSHHDHIRALSKK